MRARYGAYRVIRPLGSGGMGITLLAEDPAGSAVVIKAPRPDIIADTRRWAREVALLRSIGGVYAARAVDASPDPEADPWVAMEYYPLPNLTERVRDSGALSIDEAFTVARFLATGLEELQRARVVHRDVKPGNVLWSAGQLRLIDYGIVRSLDDDGHTKPGFSHGTPGYMSPEQYFGRTVGFPSDVFSMGCVLAYVTGGAHAYRGDALQDDQRPGFATAVEVAFDRALGTIGREFVHSVAGDDARDLAERVAGSPELGRLPAEMLVLAAACFAADPKRRPRPHEVRAYATAYLATVAAAGRVDSGESRRADSPWAPAPTATETRTPTDTETLVETETLADPQTLVTTRTLADPQTPGSGTTLTERHTRPRTHIPTETDKPTEVWAPTKSLFGGTRGPSSPPPPPVEPTLRIGAPALAMVGDQVVELRPTPGGSPSSSVGQRPGSTGSSRGFDRSETIDTGEPDVVAVDVIAVSETQAIGVFVSAAGLVQCARWSFRGGWTVLATPYTQPRLAEQHPVGVRAHEHNGIVTIVVADSRGTLHCCSGVIADGIWSDWIRLDGSAGILSFAFSTIAPGTLELFALYADGTLRQRWWGKDLGWSPWRIQIAPDAQESPLSGLHITHGRHGLRTLGLTDQNGGVMVRDFNVLSDPLWSPWRRVRTGGAVGAGGSLLLVGPGRAETAVASEGNRLRLVSLEADQR